MKKYIIEDEFFFKKKQKKKDGTKFEKLISYNHF